MKFEWIEEGDGRYRVQFFDMDEKKVFDIKITDYSDPYWAAIRPGTEDSSRMLL